MFAKHICGRGILGVWLQAHSRRMPNDCHAHDLAKSRFSFPIISILPVSLQHSTEQYQCSLISLLETVCGRILSFSRRIAIFGCTGEIVCQPYQHLLDAFADTLTPKLRCEGCCRFSFVSLVSLVDDLIGLFRGVLRDPPYE